MSRELPYFRWYPADAESDEKYSAMTDEELGFFHRCLNKAWKNDGLPADSVRRALVMKTPQEIADRLWRPECWVTHRSDDTRLANKRQETAGAIRNTKPPIRRPRAEWSGKKI